MSPHSTRKPSKVQPNPPNIIGILFATLLGLVLLVIYLALARTPVQAHCHTNCGNNTFIVQGEVSAV